MTSKTELSPIVRHIGLPLVVLGVGSTLMASSCESTEGCDLDRDCDRLVNTLDKNPDSYDGLDIDNDGKQNDIDGQPYIYDPLPSITSVPSYPNGPTTSFSVPGSIVTRQPVPPTVCLPNPYAYPDKDQDGYADNSPCDLDNYEIPSDFDEDSDSDGVKNGLEESGCKYSSDCDNDGRGDSYDTNDHNNESRESSQRQTSKQQTSKRIVTPRTTY